MKLVFKILIGLFVIIILTITSLIIFVKTSLPNVGAAPDIKIEVTQERVIRGKYLAHHVAACIDCHSTRDWTKFSGPLVQGTIGAGGEVFDQNFGFPGKFISKNITPYGIGNWTDGEIFRAITVGVSKDGTPLFPVMPYKSYGNMDQEDIYAIIAYLRTLTPVKKDIEKSVADFPMSIIIHTIPQDANPTPRPDTADQVVYGKYLFTSAACNDCHTKQDKGQPIAGMESAGGFEFPLANKTIVRSSNITPDIETGIGRWNEKAFINRFKAFADSNYVPQAIGEGDFNSIMPWSMYSQINEKDLTAIYAYMRTLKPIKNKVERYTKI